MIVVLSVLSILLLMFLFVCWVTMPGKTWPIIQSPPLRVYSPCIDNLDPNNPPQEDSESYGQQNKG